jgi:hypothetical protein
MAVMAKKKSDPPKPPAKPAGRKRPVLFVTLDDATERQLVAFIGRQRVPPDRSSVGLAALREFLQREGFWPPPAGK